MAGETFNLMDECFECSFGADCRLVQPDPSVLGYSNKYVYFRFFMTRKSDASDSLTDLKLHRTK